MPIKVIQRETEALDFGPDGEIHAGKHELIECPLFDAGGKQITDPIHYHIRSLLYALAPEVGDMIATIMMRGMRKVDVSYRLEGDRSEPGFIKIRAGAILEWTDARLVTEKPQPGAILKEGWELGEQTCFYCRKKAEPVAGWTGDGYHLCWDCECGRMQDVGIEWPFVSDVVDASDFETLGFRIE